MQIPIEQVKNALQKIDKTFTAADEPVRIAIYLDNHVSDSLVVAIRDSFVPQLTTGMVAVSRLNASDLSVKEHTDIVLVLAGGSDDLTSSVNTIATCGVPTLCVAESSLDFAESFKQTPILGCVVSSDKTMLLSKISHWILQHTSKKLAFASNFPFMRVAAAHDIIADTTVSNAVTGALFFIPGSDFPIMTLQQIVMILEIGAMFGKPFSVDRLYEVAGVLLGALGSRGLVRAIIPHTPHIKWLVKSFVGASSTYLMGRVAMRYYGANIDLTPIKDRVNQVVCSAEQHFFRGLDLYNQAQ